MSNIKQTLIVNGIAIVLMLAGLIALASPANALTESQIRKCYEDWNNKSFIQGDSTYSDYIASGCNAAEACGANTVVDPGRPVTPKCTNPDQGDSGDGDNEDSPYSGGLSTLRCSVLPADICGAAENSSLGDSGLWMLLILGFNILTAGVGVVAVGAIIYAGFLYATAQDKADQTKKALDMIRNTAIGLVLFAFMFALVNFLIPGGIFTTATDSLLVAATSTLLDMGGKF